MKKYIILTCFALILSNIVISQCSYHGESTVHGTLYNNSGHSAIDNATFIELNFLFKKFGLKPKFYFLQEYNGANSLASPYSSDPNFPHGTIMMGLKHIDKLCQTSFNNACSAVAIVMAHEFGHIIQYNYLPYLKGSKTKELFADYISGIYLYYRINELSYLNLGEIAQNTYDSGDYNFTSPTHHGTREERYNALNEGYRVASLYPLNMINLVKLAELYALEQ